MRISRPCYDKPYRCPGWAGGGMRYAKVDRCSNGRTDIYSYQDFSTIGGLSNAFADAS